MRILSVDPGFASIGWAVMDYNPKTKRWHVLDLGVITTKKSNKKRNLRVSDDNFDRTQRIATELRALVEKHKPRYIAAESMSFPRSASAAAKVAMCWGVLATLATEYNLAFVCSTPQEIKLACTGDNSASKEVIQREMISKFPGAEKLGKLPKTKREHPADAVAAGFASFSSDIAKLLTQG